MVTLRNVNINDLEFLLSLDKKLHYTSESTLTPNSSGGPNKVSIDEYTNETMEEKEMQRLLNVVEKGDFVFYPINISVGSSVGFEIYNADTKERLLTFKESQTPKEYTFNRLSSYFMLPENLKQAKLLDISIVNDRSHYD